MQAFKVLPRAEDVHLLRIVGHVPTNAFKTPGAVRQPMGHDAYFCLRSRNKLAIHEHKFCIHRSVSPSAVAGLLCDTMSGNVLSPDAPSIPSPEPMSLPRLSAGFLPGSGLASTSYHARTELYSHLSKLLPGLLQIGGASTRRAIKRCAYPTRRG